MTLTQAQARTVAFIRQFRREHGFSPTRQEIADALGIAKSTAYERLTRLIELGVVGTDPDCCSRNLIVPDDEEPAPSIDFVMPPRTVAVEVGVDWFEGLGVSISFAEHGIRKGDYLLIERDVDLHAAEVAGRLVLYGRNCIQIGVWREVRKSTRRDLVHGVIRGVVRSYPTNGGRSR